MCAKATWTIRTTTRRRRAVSPAPALEPFARADNARVTTTPDYAALDPSRVLDALDAVGLRGDGRLLQLNSYENRVFQVHLEGGEVVVAKFYRPARWSDAQILEEHAFALELAAEQVPAIAPLVLTAVDETVHLAGTPPTLALYADGHRVSVSPRHAGRGPELEDPLVLEWLGRFLGRLHAVGARRPFAERRTLSPALARGACARLLDGDFIPEAERDVWERRSGEALALVEQAFADQPGLRTLRLHGDFHPGNIMWRQEGPHVVDLDDACNGPAVQDLWMLLSGDARAMRSQLVPLLDGYRSFMRFDERELALIEPLRTLRMINHSAWIAERWSDPAFPIAFPFFASAGYWSQQATQLGEQIEAMQDPPALALFS
jgi:Ser/Thr protein kinase RdoA (MazF antagonist)